MGGWLSPAGGVVYHVRARRFASRLWRPFRSELAEWLADWSPGVDAVLLVGPSAAYCLEDRFLARFQDVLVLEPDPLARWLLKRRLARLGVGHVHFRRDDPLVRGLLGAGVDLGTLLAQEPSRAVVFCNVLGQIRFLLTDDTFERWALVFQERVARALATRRWVSFHDRVSGTVAPDLDGGAGSDRALDDEEIVHRFYARPACVPTRYELVDHLTAGLWPASLPRRYFSWQVRPGRFHLIEGIRDPDPSWH